MEPSSLSKFKKYLAREVVKGDTTGKKKLIGKKIANVTKLLNDLSFWVEVERYVHYKMDINFELKYYSEINA